MITKLKLDGIAGGIIVEIRKLICRSFLENIFSKSFCIFAPYFTNTL